MLSRCLNFSRCATIYKSTSVFSNSQINIRQFHVMNNRPIVALSSNSRPEFDKKGSNKRPVFGIDKCRAFSVVAAAEAINVDKLPIPDAPIVTAAEIIQAAGEPAFASIGLGGWWPVGILQSGLEYLHIGCGLPWWGTIVVSTIILRTLLTPIVVIAQRNAAVMNNVMPEMQKIQEKMTEARQMGDAMTSAQYGAEMMALMKQNNFNPLKNMLVPFCQAPIFMSYFFGLRGMVNAPVESMQTGGLYWFTDLTMADPYFLLPLATCLTLLVNLELGVDGSRLGANPNGYLIKMGLRVLPVIMFPFIMNFSSAVVLYWTTSNVISLIQSQVFKINAVRDFCKIPRLRTFENITPQPKKKFVQGMKESWSNMKLTRELEGRKQLDLVNFERASTRPIEKTYKYDPTKVRSKQSS